MRSVALLLFLCFCSCAPDYQPNPLFAEDESCQANGGICGGGFFGNCPSEGNWRVDTSLTCSGFEVSCCFPSDAGPDAGISVEEAGQPADAMDDRHDGMTFDASAETERGGELDAPADVVKAGGGG